MDIKGGTRNHQLLSVTDASNALMNISESGKALLYNSTLLAQKSCIRMPLVGYEQLAERRLLSRRGAVVFLAIVALTVSLANRVPHGTIPGNPVAQSFSSPAKIQHRDSDASQWVAPAAVFTFLWIAESSVILDRGRNVRTRPQDDSLHNRPPPVS